MRQIVHQQEGVPAAPARHAPLAGDVPVPVLREAVRAQGAPASARVHITNLARGVPVVLRRTLAHEKLERKRRGGWLPVVREVLQKT